MNKILLLVLMMTSIPACSFLDSDNEREQSMNESVEAENAESVDRPVREPYEGISLAIAVVGDPPDIRESKRVSFTKVPFEDLKTVDETQYDAVFIMKEHHIQAAEKESAKLYRTTDLPFFFIESKKRSFTYTMEDLTYEQGYSLENKEYAVGTYFIEDQKLNWGYNTYNDYRSKKAIHEVYSNIFETIEEVKKSNEEDINT